MKKVVRGVNDLMSQKPELAKQWHPTKNGTLLPEQVAARSCKRVWWQCEKGHEWEARIDNRYLGNGCPYCAGLKVLPGFNDLLSQNPELALEWHPKKNEDFKPDAVTAGSNRRVWWQCEKGHEWQARVADRMKGSKCPRCAWKGLPKYRVLVSTMPELAQEWHPTLNGTLTPNKVLANSQRKVWWQCTQGHAWETSPINRVRKRGCPYCAARKPSQGENDLASRMPELAKQWHPTKNGALTPADVTLGSVKKVWWLCEKGHEWETKVDNRTSGLGCPVCSGKKVLPGYNDLLSQSPEIAKQWHPTKNGDLLPDQLTVRSNKAVWWQCAQGHVWKATVEARTYGSGCPACTGKRVLPGYNDLLSQVPELAKQWHPTKNGALLPEQVMVHSNKSVWWQCDNGHKWKAIIKERVNGSDCPKCKKKETPEQV